MVTITKVKSEHLSNYPKLVDLTAAMQVPCNRNQPSLLNSCSSYLSDGSSHASAFIVVCYSFILLILSRQFSFSVMFREALLDILR